MKKTPNRTASIQVAFRITPAEAEILQAAADAESSPFAKVTIGRYLLVKGLEAARRDAKGSREKGAK